MNVTKEQIQAYLKNNKLEGKVIVRHQRVQRNCRVCQNGKMLVMGETDYSKLPDCPECGGTGNATLTEPEYYLVNDCKCCQKRLDAFLSGEIWMMQDALSMENCGRKPYDTITEEEIAAG